MFKNLKLPTETGKTAKNVVWNLINFTIAKYLYFEY